MGSAVRPRGYDGGGEGHRRAAEDRLAAEAHAGVCKLGRRGAGAARLNGVGRDSCRGVAAQGRALFELGHQFTRIPGSRRQSFLQRLVNDVAVSVKDPETGVTSEERLRAKTLVDGYEKGASEREKKDAKIAAAGADLAIEALGSGSDFTPFLQHLGVTSLSIQYGGESDQAGVYHSSYDSFDHYLRFGDPGFVYGIAETETVGHVILRVADADVLPLQFAGFADAVDGYVSELHDLTEQKRKAAEELGRLLDRNAFTLASDPTRPVLAPERDPDVPYLDLAPLDNVAARLKKSAKGYDDLYQKLGAGTSKLSPAQSRELDELLRGMEGTLLYAHGLPGRDWYKHLIYAPGLYTGYGVKTLPGVREAIEQNHWDEANQYAGLTAAALTAYCDRLDQAAALLGRGSSIPN